MREFGPVDETMRLAARLMAALLVGGALAQEGEIDCKRMKAKELRQMLAARGVKCEGCAEKVPSPALPAARPPRWQRLCNHRRDGREAARHQ